MTLIGKLLEWYFNKLCYVLTFICIWSGYLLILTDMPYISYLDDTHIDDIYKKLEILEIKQNIKSTLIMSIKYFKLIIIIIKLLNYI